MGEAEDAFEVTSRLEVVAGDEVVAVLRGVDVGPQEPPQRVVGRQFVSCHDGQRTAGRQVDPAEMTDQREVRRGRAQRQPARQRPLRVGRGARAGVAVDPDRREAPVAVARLGLEGHDRAQRTQSGVVLELVQHAQIPGKGAVGLGGDVAGEWARHRECAEVGPLILPLSQCRRPYRRRKAMPEGGRCTPRRSDARVGVHRKRKAALLRRQQSVHRRLEAGEHTLDGLTFVGGDTVRHQRPLNGDAAVLRREGHQGERSVRDRYRHGVRPVSVVLEEAEPVPEPATRPPAQPSDQPGLTVGHGANAFFTPSRWLASSGKFRASTVPMSLSAIHARPSAL